MLLVADYRFNALDNSKSLFLTVSQPLYWLVDMPGWIGDWGKQRLVGREELRLENARLEMENRILQAKLQKLQALTIENIRLRELLNSTRLLDENAVIAEIIAVSPSPYNHYVVINRGQRHQVYPGQAVIDANGLFGQITDVAADTSRVMLITDSRHAVPVQVDRNGVRLTVEGTGDFMRMRVPFVALTTDLVPGDVLSTSGLGGVFPANYPVARVIDVEHQPGESFADVVAEPFARMSRSRHVLLLFPHTADYEN